MTKLLPANHLSAWKTAMRKPITPISHDRARRFLLWAVENHLQEGLFLHATRADLASEYGISSDSVRRYLRRGVDHGWITAIYQSRGGRGTPSTYAVRTEKGAR